MLDRARCAHRDCGHYRGHHHPEGPCIVVACDCPAFQTKPSKYRAQRVACDTCALVHDSKKERARCWELAALEAAGAIHLLRRQTPFALDVNGHHIATYRADFTYLRDGEEIVEDVKSPATRKLAPYRLKKRLLWALHGLTILET